MHPFGPLIAGLGLSPASGHARIGPGGQPATGRPSARPIAFVDVTVVPMTADTVLPHYTVVVEGDRIVAVGRSSLPPPPGEFSARSPNNRPWRLV